MLTKDTHEIEVFRAGTHTDSNGAEDVYTVSDLDEMVRSFSPSNPFPLVIGHPAPDDSAPAYGWAESVLRRGDKLVCKLKSLTKEVRDWLNDKHYNRVSIGVFPREHPSNPTPGWLNIYHVGLLGASPPAIPGLEPVQQFSAFPQLKCYSTLIKPMDLETKLTELEARLAALEPAQMASDSPDSLFNEDEENESLEDELKMAAPPTANPLIDAIMAQLGGDLNAIAEEQDIPLETLNAAIAGAEELTPEQNEAIATALVTNTFSAMPDKDYTQEIANLRTKLAKQEEQINKYAANLLKDRRALEAEKIKAFAANLVKELKIRPTEEEDVIATLIAADNTKTVTFSANNKRTFREQLMAQYESRSPLVNDATGLLPDESGKVPHVSAPKGYSANIAEMQTHQKILALSQEKGVTYTAAAKLLKESK